MSPLGLLSQDAKIVNIYAYASGTATATSDVIDTVGYRGLCVVIINAAVHDSAVTVFKLSHSDTATNETTLASGADIAGTSQACSIVDNTVQYIDGHPAKRFVQLTITKDATNASAHTAVAILYNGKSRPTIHGLGTATVGEGVAATAGETAGSWTTGTA